MGRRDRPSQLNLFPTAPADTGGRSASGGRVQEYVDAAMAKGCTHVEVSKDAALLVMPSLVGRDDAATYLPLSDSRVRKAMTKAKTWTSLLRMCA